MGFYQKDMILQKYLSKEEEYRFHDKGKKGKGGGGLQSSNELVLQFDFEDISAT